ncbi:hypothetical protein D3C78_1481700 [compost metagenome]
MIGQKVTSELTVIVNGKELSSKGAVINGMTNAPVRALVDAVGGTLQLEGKVITITTEATQSTTSEASNPSNNSNISTNKYIGGSKKSLETVKDSIENNRIKPAVEGRDQILAEIEQLKKSWENPDLTKINKQLGEYEDIIEKATEELRLVNEALEALE